jgi:hypothetical protein
MLAPSIQLLSYLLRRAEHAQAEFSSPGWNIGRARRRDSDQKW